MLQSLSNKKKMVILTVHSNMDDTYILGVTKQKKTNKKKKKEGTYCEYSIGRVNLLKNVKMSYCWITAEHKYK